MSVTTGPARGPRSDPGRQPRDPDLVKSASAAKYLAISRSHLGQLTRKRLIPSFRIGQAIRYDLNDLRDWIAQQKGGEG